MSAAIRVSMPGRIRRTIRRVAPWLRPRALGTIRGRLTFGFGATVVLVAAIAVIAVSALRAASAGNAQALGSVEQEFEGSQRVITAALREIASGVQYLESGAEVDRERWETMMARAEAARGDAAKVSTLTPEQRTRLEEVGNLQSAVEVRIAMAQAFRRIGEPGQAAPLVRTAFDDVEQIDRKLEQFRAGSTERRAEIVVALDEALRRDQLLVIVLGLVAVIVAIIFGVGTSRAVTRPLAAFAVDMEAMGEGDLRLAIDDHTGAAEFAKLAQALRRARERLGALVSHVQVESEQVSSAANQLAASATSVSDAASHMTRGIADIAQGASAQLEALGSASDAVRRLSDAGTAIQSAVSATGAAGGEIRTTANDARSELALAVATLREAANVATASAEEIRELQEATAAVDNFATLIGSIASQTNLLALNAAIEAARAGAYGRGFAVVAEEVRLLADQSHQASEEVAESVRRIREKIDRAVGSVGAGTSRMRDARKVAESASTSLDRIERAIASVDEATLQVEEVVAVSRQLIGEVDGAMERVRAAAEGHAAAAQEVAAAAEESAGSMQEVSATAQQLQMAANRVQGMTQEFRTEEFRTVRLTEEFQTQLTSAT
jgi:methyl-accepting chemotaxis protein